jgi:aminoglycoside/choline kinase family phosphotransferase
MNPLRPELAMTLAEMFPNARVESLAADASTRRFHRLRLPDASSRIVMDYGAPFEGETDDVRLARIFERASLPVAKVLEVLPEAGALVLQDLGDETLEAALTRTAAAGREERSKLYRGAVELAADIAYRGTEALRRSDRARGPALDEERFQFEMRFFLEHYVGGYLLRDAALPGLREALSNLASTVAADPRVLCHRDYHSRNIMVRPGGALAMVDIQDARWGPDTYDLASLLRDAYVDLDDAEVDGLFACYAAALPDSPELGSLRKRFDRVAIQRMIKALGTFGYQISVLGRERYRTAIPRTVERLRLLLPKDAELAPIAAFFAN